ncbi:hypothetical protein VW23_024425 [Devosia insulae DS-56]|uniref:Excalibur calcium-binding domain-containing protein n=1 Tax=Devosia insulae DS-56 TaxID=1116389 RepID=A0A1E5XM89_9HYPH|nr:hypothetical protein VW23_024425 [Devosia insulae DS-56]
MPLALSFLLTAAALIVPTTADEMNFRHQGSFIYLEFPPPPSERTALGQPSFFIMPGAPLRFEGIQPRFAGVGAAYAPGDLDCQDVGQAVVMSGSDPNNLDADGDGIGCEAF